MIDIFEPIFKHITKELAPEIVFKTEIIKNNAKQRYVVVREYFAQITSKFYSMPNISRIQVLSTDTSENKSRALAYTISAKLSEKYNFDLDNVGDIVSTNGIYHIASLQQIQKPISIGLQPGGGYVYSQNFEIKF